MQVEDIIIKAEYRMKKGSTPKARNSFVKYFFSKENIWQLMVIILLKVYQIFAYIYPMQYFSYFFGIARLTIFMLKKKEAIVVM